MKISFIYEYNTFYYNGNAKIQIINKEINKSAKMYGKT